MEEFTSNFLTAIDEAPLPEGDGGEDEGHQEAEADSAKKGRGFRSGIFRAASLQDSLLEKLLSQVIPAEDGQGQHLNRGSDLPAYASERPGFSLPLMTANFRRFNARIGVVFSFQTRVFRLLSWRRPTQTLSLLAVYTFVCLDPYLLFALPLAIALFGILVPSFVARHPAPSSDPDRVRNLRYSPRGPPLAPARTVKPAKELSRDFFRNMGDLQNVMEDFSVAHDKIIALVVPKTNFSDEALSSAVFVLLFAACLVMLIAAHLLPLRFLALVGGWAGICSGHPALARWIHQAKVQYTESQQQQENNQKQPAPKWYHPSSLLQTLLSDIHLDLSPETREVEIFELQRLSPSSGEWEPWLFSPSPYDPLSAARIAGDRPQGTRFFEDVLPPEGWEWSEKKWALDLWSREWVEERIITGVEVETEGERWVYDMWSGGEAGVEEGEESGNRQGRLGPGVSWEEGEEGTGRRGQWRRRRWVRTVKRKKVTSAGS
ncbi:integral peroxisomal membrane peroxin-domain-containing protein [Achaetomium macrosporum]|uniref:Integral peroxisomal membrane peroxin-domain-containing protein n=1 Tax=Achaetomium macrosporum TaxID=79813 RepID=A0AAN7CGK7_9PEZI|nr:integral peroxisomal membrane peroxin-domain-containing protein [Achaetomium macrosporum]